jgi:hypothetical protein
MGSTFRDVDTDAMKNLRAVSGRRKLSPRQKEAVLATRQRMAAGYTFASAAEVRDAVRKGGTVT